MAGRAGVAKAFKTAGALRLKDIPQITRRVAGMSYLSAEAFQPAIETSEAERVATLVKRARGPVSRPIFLFGVMPRSGTNFLHDVLALHPEVMADPGRLYEFPLLHAASHAMDFADDFLSFYPRNGEVVGRLDPLAMLAGAWQRELQAEAGSRRMLLKCPHVQNLTLAPALFPESAIILCLRDGRDVISSWLKSFSGRGLLRKTFTQLADEWRLSAEAILEYRPDGPRAHPDVTVIRYEDIQSGSHEALQRLLEAASLDPERFDRAAFDRLPVRGSSRPQTSGTVHWGSEERLETFRPVGRWKEWPKRRQRAFDRIAGATLEKAGYARSAA